MAGGVVRFPIFSFRLLVTSRPRFFFLRSLCPSHSTRIPCALSIWGLIVSKDGYVPFRRGILDMTPFDSFKLFEAKTNE